MPAPHDSLTLSRLVERITSPDVQELKALIAATPTPVMHLIDGSLSTPFNRNPAVTLGHEVAGAIEAIGPDVTGREIGQRVVLQ